MIQYFRNIITVVFLLLGIVQAADIKPCPEDWIHGERQCLFVDSERVTWSQAAEKCKCLGATLVEVESRQKDRRVKFLMLLYDIKHIWTGAILNHKDNVWVWFPRNNSMSYQDWGTGEPSNPATEKCMEIREVDIYKYQWNDSNCRSKYAVMCQRPDYW